MDGPGKSITGVVVEARDIPWIDPHTGQLAHTPEGYPKYMRMIMLETAEGKRVPLYRVKAVPRGCFN